VAEQVSDARVVEQRDGPASLLQVEHLPRASALRRGHDPEADARAGFIAAEAMAAGSRSARDRPVRARSA
jgi:hypothetical protein